MNRKTKDVRIHTSELETRIRMEDVSEDSFINPRSGLSYDYVNRYEEDITGYLLAGEDFNEVWRQSPEVVEKDDEDGVYLLTSGYHTLTALKNVVAKVKSVREKLKEQEEQDGDGDSKVHQPVLSAAEMDLAKINTDFFIDFKVWDKEEGISAETAARYHAAFSNLHGQPLKSGEKSRAAYHALSQMNMMGENNPELFPYMTNEALSAKLSVSRGTIDNQRKKLRQERFGGDEEEEAEELKKKCEPSPEPPTPEADTTPVPEPTPQPEPAKVRSRVVTVEFQEKDWTINLATPLIYFFKLPEGNVIKIGKTGSVKGLSERKSNAQTFFVREVTVLGVIPFFDVEYDPEPEEQELLNRFGRKRNNCELVEDTSEVREYIDENCAPAAPYLKAYKS